MIRVAVEGAERDLGENEEPLVKVSSGAREPGAETLELPSLARTRCIGSYRVLVDTMSRPPLDDKANAPS